MMTAQDFIANGYKVSLQIQQGEIDRAVTDVTAAYVAKVTTNITTDAAKAAIMQLVFILLCQRNTFVQGQAKRVLSESHCSVCT